MLAKATKENAEHFKNFYDALEDENCIKDYFHYLMNLDISDFDCRRDRVETRFMNDMKGYNYKIFDKFLVKIYHEVEDLLKEAEINENTTHIECIKD